MNDPHSIEMHIEELVLHGFEPGDRHAIGDAVERELARLLSEHGLPSASAGGYERARVAKTADKGVFLTNTRVAVKTPESYRAKLTELWVQRAEPAEAVEAAVASVPVPVERQPQQ